MLKLISVSLYLLLGTRKTSKKKLEIDNEKGFLMVKVRKQ